MIDIQQSIRDSSGAALQSRPTLSKANVRWLNQEHVVAVAQILSHPLVKDNIWYNKDTAGFTQIINRWLTDPTVYCLIELDPLNSPIGVCRLQRWKHEKKDHVATIGPLAIHPDHWRQGHATNLMKTAIQLCNVLGIHRLEAAVPADSVPTNSLFSSLGFRKEGIQRDALKRYNAYCDIVQYGYLVSATSMYPSP